MSSTSATYAASLIDAASHSRESVVQKLDFDDEETLHRVKVCVRCRPPFEDEVADNGNQHQQQQRAPPLAILESSNSDDRPTRIVLNEQERRKTRDFQYDCVFDPTASQQDVYNDFAQPIVLDVLSGINGTILAYGQTGTGKTYTMGILDPVFNRQDSGIIPRALEQVFDHLERSSRVTPPHHPSRGARKGPVVTKWSVSMTFVQIYIDMVQDLFAPVASDRQDESLTIRQDPDNGFYVEGLVECPVASYDEAIALLNFGLENRNMASTVMNSSSSRSHTILSVQVSQVLQSPQGTSSAGSTEMLLKSKLLLVDLAGSERIRRTSSTGKRLAEARSINGSLSALGNVIAALAEQSSHVRFRDSKLTKLLQETLSGRSTAALIATVSPAEQDVGESLSTLQFASRCMHVKISPVVNQETNYADLCAHLQLKLANLETEHTKKLNRVRSQYETEIKRLNRELRAARGAVGDHATATTTYRASMGASGDFEVTSTTQLPGPNRGASGRAGNDPFVQQVKGFVTALHGQLEQFSQKACQRQEAMNRGFQDLIEKQRTHDLQRESGPSSFRSDAYDAVANRFSHVVQRPSFPAEWSVEDPRWAAQLLKHYSEYLECLGSSEESMEAHFNNMRTECINQIAEQRARDEELVNWSFILKYLLSNNSKLRNQVKDSGSKREGPQSEVSTVIDLPESFSQVDNEVGNNVRDMQLLSALQSHERSTDHALKRGQRVENVADLTEDLLRDQAVNEWRRRQTGRARSMDGKLPHKEGFQYEVGSFRSSSSLPIGIGVVGEAKEMAMDDFEDDGFSQLDYHMAYR